MVQTDGIVQAVWYKLFTQDQTSVLLRTTNRIGRKMHLYTTANSLAKPTFMNLLTGVRPYIVTNVRNFATKQHLRQQL